MRGHRIDAGEDVLQVVAAGEEGRLRVLTDEALADTTQGVVGVEYVDDRDIAGVVLAGGVAGVED